MSGKSIMEIAIKAIAEKFYDDSKLTLKKYIDKKFSPHYIEQYLKQEIDHYKFIKNILFGGDRIKFDDAYNKHKLSVADQMIKDYEVDNLFLTYKQLSLVGTAGIGKSTFVQHLFRESIKKKYKIPVTIELRTIGRQTNLLRLIGDKISTSTGTIPEEFLADQLNKGNFIIFFDGYDEVMGDNIEFVNALLIETAKSYNKVDILLTSRPYANVEHVNSFKICKLQPFSPSDVVKFIDKISFFYEPEFIKNLKVAIAENKGQKVRDFLSNPLLLSLYILSFQTCSAEVPSKISTFYNHVITALFQQHDTVSKNSFNRILQSKISKREAERFLTKFSFVSTMNDSYSFSKSKIEIDFDRLKEKFNFDFDNTDFYSDMTKSLALWVFESSEYKFSHRSLQEYFFAKAISLLTEKKKEKFYNDLSDGLTCTPSKMKMRELSNKFQLLNELDHRAFCKYFFIPLSEYRYDLSYENHKDLIEEYIRTCISCSYIAITKMPSDSNNTTYTCTWCYENDNKKGFLHINLESLYPSINKHIREIMLAISNTINNNIERFPISENRARPMEIFNTKEQDDFAILINILFENDIHHLIIKNIKKVNKSLKELKTSISVFSHDQILDFLD